MNRSQKTAALFSLTVVLTATSALAVDPLPPYLRNAPESAQLEYVEREGRRSQALKLEVGRQRFQKRMEEKSNTVAFLAQAAEANRREIQGQMAFVSGSGGNAPSTESPASSAGHTNLALVMGVIATATLFLIARKKFFPPPADE